MVITAIPMFEAQQDEVVIYWTEESLHVTVSAKYERRLMLQLADHMRRHPYVKTCKLDDATSKHSENTSYVITLHERTNANDLDTVRRGVRNQAESWLSWARKNIPTQVSLF